MIFRFESKEAFRNCKVTICGTGWHSLELFIYCYQLKLEVKQFVSDETAGVFVFSRPVTCISDLDLDEDEDIILGNSEMKEFQILKEKGYVIYQLEDIWKEYKCKNHEFLLEEADYVNFVQEQKCKFADADFVLDSIKLRKRLILSDGTMLPKFSLFQMMKHTIEGGTFVCIGTEEENRIMKEFLDYLYIHADFYLLEDKVSIKNIKNDKTDVLFYSEIDNTLTPLLIENGFVIGHTIKTFLNYMMDALYERDVIFDINLGYTMLTHGSKYIGFKEYGNYEKAKYKIVALGNSTTDAGDKESDESWPYFLFELLEKEYPGQVAVLNGGIAAYNMTQELLKFLRDVSPLKPDMCISFSGWCNISQNNDYPFEGGWKRKLNNFIMVQDNDNLVFRNMNREMKYIGEKNTISRYRFFSNQAKQLHAAADAVGIDYRCFIQPNLYVKNSMSLSEKQKMIYYNSMREKNNTDEFFGDSQLKLDMEECNWLYNLVDIFDDMDDIYYDTHHPNEKGNRIIAKRIYDEIIKTIRGGI